MAINKNKFHTFSDEVRENGNKIGFKNFSKHPVYASIHQFQKAKICFITAFLSSYKEAQPGKGMTPVALEKNISTGDTSRVYKGLDNKGNTIVEKETVASGNLNEITPLAPSMLMSDSRISWNPFVGRKGVKMDTMMAFGISDTGIGPAPFPIRTHYQESPNYPNYFQVVGDAIHSTIHGGLLAQVNGTFAPRFVQKALEFAKQEGLRLYLEVDLNRLTFLQDSNKELGLHPLTSCIYVGKPVKGCEKTGNSPAELEREMKQNKEHNMKQK